MKYIVSIMVAGFLATPLSLNTDATAFSLDGRISKFFSVDVVEGEF